MQGKITNDGTIELGFSSLEEAKSFFDGVRETQGAYLEVDRLLQFFERRKIRATAGDAFDFAFEAEVVQCHPMAGGFGAAFQLCDWPPEKEKQLEQALAGKTPELSDSQLSPMHRIKKMNPTERFILATKASRVERQILIRDSSPQVLMGLLNHPRLENKEVIEILKSHFVTGGVLEHVARNRKWLQHPEVPALIAKNPKTPQPLAIKLLDLLQRRDLQQLAKSSGTREGLKKAALKLYLKRIGSR